MTALAGRDRLGQHAVAADGSAGRAGRGETERVAHGAALEETGGHPDYAMTRPSVLHALALGLLVAFLAACGGDPEEPPVIEVDGYTVSEDAYRRAYLDHLVRTGRNDTDAERLAFADDLVNLRLLATEAGRRGYDSTAAFSDFRQRVRDKAVGEVFFRNGFLDTLGALPPGRLERAFRNSRDKVVLRHLFFATRAQAEAASERLRRGADFVRLAQEVYGVPGDLGAGLLGEATYWALDDAVAEAAFDLGVGEVSGPVQSRYGWHILRVEDRLRQPLASETEFARRQVGIEGLLRARIRRSGGREFVGAVMGTTDPQIRPEGVRLLRVALREHVTPNDGPVEVREVEEVRQALQPSTPLFTYTLGGAARTFTAADYLRWLPELSTAEALARPAQSVARALRNEVFARLGEAERLDGDPFVAEEVGARTTRYLAFALRHDLRQSGADPTPAEVRGALARAGGPALQETRGDLWAARFETRAEAERARKAVAGGADPAGLPGYRTFDDVDLGALDIPVRRLPVGDPYVVAAGDRYAVVSVSRREEVRAAAAAAEAETAETLRPLVPEARLLRRLRSQAAVSVDTARVLGR